MGVVNFSPSLVNKARLKVSQKESLAFLLANFSPLVNKGLKVSSVRSAHSERTFSLPIAGHR